MNSAPEPSVAATVSAADIAQAYFQLTKPRITLLVLISMAIGFVIGTDGGFDSLVFIHACIGTFLIASGTAAFNQYIERDLDKLMYRTMTRPLPTHKVKPVEALRFSIILIVGGLFYMITFVNNVAAFFSISTTALYLLAYTPLKRLSFLNLYVGAIPGALPPVGGWAAATGEFLHPGMWLLFAIVFLWQIPHVTAIAWLYLDDYSRGGFIMLPRSNDNGRTPALLSLVATVGGLVPVILLFTTGQSSWILLAGGASACFYYLYWAFKFVMERSKVNARALLIGSVIYLPAVWLFLLADYAFR